jgi:phosphonate transport system permease protein
VVVGLALLWPGLVLTEFKPWILLEPGALKPALNFIGTFFPPRVDADFLWLLARETWRTVAMATAGLSLGLLLAVPLSLLSVRVLSLSALTGRMAAFPAVLRQLVRWLLMVLRSVPELVWALVFVRVVGLGPTSGVLAIALTYGGMLGKVYADILESGDAHATASLMRNGSGRLQAFFYGLLPQNAGELTSYTVYRWECAIRSSAVLGFVGAGGLGQLMDSSMKMFSGSEVASILLVFMALVWLADRLSAALRARFASWLVLGVVAMVVASFATLHLQWMQFASMDAAQRMGRFLRELLQPETGTVFLTKVMLATLETLAMSAIGTLMAVVLGLALALPASKTFRQDPARWRGPTRLLLNALRSTPELVWAALLLIAAGLGPFAGTLALGLHTAGVLGRLFAESLENASPGPAFALRVRGAGEVRVFWYATLPQVLPQLVSYTLYRWENNIRAAAVLGVVGAGGLGGLLSFHMGLFQMGETSTVLMAMLFLVAVVDALSYWARHVLSR